MLCTSMLLLHPPNAKLKTVPDIVLRGQGLKDGDGEGNSVGWLMHHFLGQQPGLRVVDVLIL